MIKFMAVELSYSRPQLQGGDVEHEENILSLPNRGLGRQENLG